MKLLHLAGVVLLLLTRLCWAEYTPDLVAAEAFFDTDPGVGAGMPLSVTPASDVVVVDNVSLSGLGLGFHALFVRYQDSHGNWSPPTRRSFYLMSETTTGSSVVGGELFFDNDPGQGGGIPLSVAQGTDVTVDTSISSVGLTRGFHKLKVRYRTSGAWSSPIQRSFSVIPENLGPNYITGGEMFLDTDPGIGHGCMLTASDGAFDESDEDMSRLALASNLALGQHYAYARTQDAHGFWSPVRRAGFSVIEAHLVATNADSNSGNVRLTWTKYLEALEYHVHYDSVVTGQFTDYIMVNAPDTSLALVPSQQNYVKRFYRVFAVLPDAELCVPSMLGRGGLRSSATLPSFNYDHRKKMTTTK